MPSTLSVNTLQPASDSGITINSGIFDKPTFTTRIIERANVISTAVSGNVNLDMVDKGVIYYTANATGNVTVNFRGNSTVTLNNMMATGDVASIVILLTNGTTAYLPTVYQVDGTAVTPKWSGNSSPTSGNANSIDLYSFTVCKTASATYTILGAQTQFK